MRRRVSLSIALPALLASSILLIFVTAASGGDPAALRNQADYLRAQNTGLAGQAQSVELELYGLDSRLATAQANLARTTARVAALRRQQSAVAESLSVARHSAQVSRSALDGRLRDLYEQGDTDPLAILLGAESLDDAVARLDDMRSLAEDDRAVIDQTQTTGHRLQRLTRALAARRDELNSLEQQAADAVGQIQTTRSERAVYLARLGTERQLNLVRISSLESQAEEAAARSAQLNEAAAAAPPQPAVVSFDPVPVAPAAASGANSLTVLATAYSLPGSTATGAPVGYGIVAVDPSVIPLGTRMTIPGYGEGTAADVGPGISGAMIDLWFPTNQQALGWGRRTVTITLH